VCYIHVTKDTEWITGGHGQTHNTTWYCEGDQTGKVLCTVVRGHLKGAALKHEYCLAVHKNTCKHSLELVGVENKSLKFGSISSSEWEVLCQHIVLEIRVHTYVTIRRLLSAVRTNCVASFRFTSKQQWGEPVNIRESHNHPHIDSFKRTGYIQGLCTPRVEAIRCMCTCCCEMDHHSKF